MRISSSSIEALEARIAPAAVFKFTDVDGDAVTITTSKGTNADLAAIVTLVDEGIGKELQLIDFSLNPGVFAGTNVTITAGRGAAGGDGFVNVGFIDASPTGGGTGVDLGTVKIRGDLGRIEAGDASTGTTAVKALSVQSMGEYGITTQQAGNLVSIMNGKLGSLNVTGNMRDAVVATAAEGIGSVKIGGSIIAGGVSSSGDLGPVKVGGNLQGGTAIGTGTIVAIGNFASLTIGGSVIGGSAFETGVIISVGVMGPVKIAGNLIGGDGLRSGRLEVDSNATSITIGGSLIGGSSLQAGFVSADGRIGRIKITGDVIGGDYDGPGQVGRLGSIQAKGITNVFIGGSIISGRNSGSGTLEDSGSIRVIDDIGTITIKGSLIGNTGVPVLITARGQAVPGASSDVAIRSLNVGGRVEFADILAGYSVIGSPFALNGDAQIGVVMVAGDWIASSLVAGVQDDSDPSRDDFFGDGDDQVISGGSAAIISKISSITIRGAAIGTLGAGDHFGFVAQQIGSLKIGATKIPLAAGLSTDLLGLPLGITGDLRVREVL